MNNDAERPPGVPPPISLRPGYGTWTCLVAATCAFGIVIGGLWFNLAAPILLAMTVITWWIRRHTRTILAAILDVIAIPMFVILGYQIVEQLAWFVGLVE